MNGPGDKLPNPQPEPESDGLWLRAYDVLRRLAAGYMRGERKDHTLDPTALVNEAYLRLSSMRERMPAGEADFIALASHKMRQVLVDHARRSRSQKRGQLWDRVTLDEGLVVAPRRDLDIADLDEAMQALEADHPEVAKVVELRFFMGMSAAEVAAVQDVSRQAVERRWTFAKAWLARELRPRGEEQEG